MYNCIIIGLYYTNNMNNCVFVQAVPYKNVSKTENNTYVNVNVNNILFNMNHAKKIKYFGLNGRTENDAFTIACHKSHKKALYKFIKSKQKNVVIFESDAKPVSPFINLPSIIDKISNYTSWDIINLGRCWDLCNNDHYKYKLTKKHQLVSSLTPECTHSYAISLQGAIKLFHYTNSYFIPLDFLIPLLHRTNKLQVYSITPRLFTQERNNNSHDTKYLPECDPKPDQVLRMIGNKHSVYKKIKQSDETLLNLINKNS